VSCEYTVDQKEDMIRDQVVDGCKSTELRRKLLAVENLTLDKVRKIARTYELFVTHASKMDKGEDSIKIQKKKKSTKYKRRSELNSSQGEHLEHLTDHLRQFLPVEQSNAIVVTEVDIMGRNAK
jgi:hypothetical protein